MTVFFPLPASGASRNIRFSPSVLKEMFGRLARLLAIISILPIVSAASETHLPPADLSPALSRPVDPGPGAIRLCVQVRSARVRMAPDYRAAVIAGLKEGDAAEWLGSMGNWYRIRFEGERTGWAHRDLFSQGVKPQAAAPFSEPMALSLPEQKEIPSREPVARSEPTLPLASPPGPEMENPPEPGQPFEGKVKGIHPVVSTGREEVLLLVLDGFEPPECRLVGEPSPEVLLRFSDVPADTPLPPPMALGGRWLLHLGAEPGEAAKKELILKVLLTPGHGYAVETVHYPGQGIFLLMVRETPATGTARHAPTPSEPPTEAAATP